MTPFEKHAMDVAAKMLQAQVGETPGICEKAMEYLFEWWELAKRNRDAEPAE